MVKACIKCGATDRNKQGDCRPCTKAYQVAYLRSHSARIKIREAASYAANSEKLKAYQVAYRKANIEKLKTYHAVYRKANREKIKVYKDAYRKANPEKCRIYTQNRRAQKRASGGKLSHGLARKLLALGGTNTDSNMQLLRAKCNKEIGKALGVSQSQAGILYSGTKLKIGGPVNVRVDRKPNPTMKFGAFDRPPVELDLAMMKFKKR